MNHDIYNKGFCKGKSCNTSWLFFNSSNPVRCRSNFRSTIFELHECDSWAIDTKILPSVESHITPLMRSRRWSCNDLMSSLNKHYLNQYWLSSASPYGVITHVDTLVSIQWGPAITWYCIQYCRGWSWTKHFDFAEDTIGGEQLCVFWVPHASNLLYTTFHDNIIPGYPKFGPLKKYR